MNPYYDKDGITIYNGDCLDVIAKLDGSIDAVVMDPPFASGTRKEMGKTSSGAMVRGGRFSDKPIECDQMTTTGFVWLMRAIAHSARDSMPDGSSIVSFIDWRQWPNLVGAFETLNFRIQAMVVWDKQSFGMGNGFRRQHELICHASKGVPTIHSRSFGDVLTFKRDGETNHPSPKPVALMESLLEVVTKERDVVLDPFCGSGSTLVAAKSSGRRAIGIEAIESHCETAANRLAQGVLF